MQAKVLNNKIGIQILVIFLGILLLVLGIIYAAIGSEIIFTGTIRGYSDIKLTGDYINTSSIILGTAIAAIGFISILIAAIKISNYYILMNNSTQKAGDDKQEKNSEGEQRSTSFDDMRSKIAYLQQMKSDGLISETEYDDMKSLIIKKAGGSL